MNFYILAGLFALATILLWWFNRWNRKRAEYVPENWIHRHAAKAWRK